VQLDPHSARYWFDLSSAYQVLGDTPNQNAALERAIEADSMTPDVAWEAGNFYLVQGQTEKALREFRVVIANDPSLADAALQFCWRIEPDVDVLLRDFVPVRSDAYIGFLTLLQSKEQTAGAAKVWNALMQTHESFESRYGYDYIRYSIQHKDVDQAVLAWKQMASRFGLSSYLASTNNLVVNGNFNLNILNAGFDWQYQKQAGVNLSLDNSDYHSGRRSLQITFDGPGIMEAGIYELVAVQPNTTYEFNGYYKSGEIEGAGGPHFTVQDMYTQAVYYESEELKDAGFWKSVDGEFTTGPDCKLVVLHVRRLPAGSPIRGKLWVDDFHLTAKAS
jgi:tetratricopeptide (TPR) repeat protein